MRLKHFGDYLVYLLVRVFICIVQAVRPRTCRSVARALAVLACDVVKLRAAVVDENLSSAYPKLTPGERRDLARRMWEHLFLMVAEIAHTPRKIHRTTWRTYIRFQNMEPTVRLLLEDRPVVFVSGHYGNFELSGYLLGLVGFPTFTVARTLDNPFLDNYLNRFRGATGQSMLPKIGASKVVDRMLASGGTLALLGDQAAGPKGCWVDFFGRPASTHKAIAVFSLVNDAPLSVGYARRIDDPLHYEIAVEAIADPRSGAEEVAGVRELTEWYSRQLENIINRAPDQYWWVHRRWKGEPPRRRRRDRAA